MSDNGDKGPAKVTKKVEPQTPAQVQYSRDGFAAQAMNALVLAHYTRGLVPTDEEIAKDAYYLADAMLAAREA
jgi:hypothetical protein